MDDQIVLRKLLKLNRNLIEVALRHPRREL